MLKAEAGTMTVLVASQSSIVQLGLKQLLQSDPDFMVSEYAPGMGPPPELRAIFADSDILREDGFVNWLKASRGEAKLVVLLLRVDTQAIAEALVHGIDGLLHPSTDPSAMLSSVKLVSTFGNFVVSPNLVRPLARTVAAVHAEQQGIGVTPREQQVLSLLDQGYSDAAIAQALFLSVRTVKQHVSHILQKLQAQNRHHAVEISRSLELLAPGTRKINF